MRVKVLADNTNFYYQQNQTYFNQLVQLVSENPKHFHKLLNNEKYAELLFWVNSSLPLLSDPFYQIRTKCYWIFNGLIDFPICPVCQKQDNYIIKNVKINKGYAVSCCRECMYKNIDRNQRKNQTMILRYGGISPLSSPDILKKAQNTCQKNHGAKCPFCKESDVYSHLFDKCSEKLGRQITNPSQLPGHREKCQATNLKNHGNPNWRNLEQAIKTNISRRGVPYSVMDPCVQQKAKLTFIANWDVDNPFKAETVKAIIRKSTFDHFGYEFSQQCPDIRYKSQKKYNYNNMTFDSSTELEFYIYLTDCRYKVYHKHNIVFKYIFNGKMHIYHPDFLTISPYGAVEIIEIKGDQFFREDGTMFCPYRDKNETDEQYAEKCALYEAKRQCMLANNVTILRYESDYMKFVRSYIITKYGKDFAKRFKYQ